MSRQVRWTYAFVDRPAGLLASACEFWTAVTDTRLSGLRGGNKEFTTLLHDEADACVKMQGVASGPGGAHLDFPVADVREFMRSAVALGAEVVADHGTWAVLRSPAGQPLCTMPWRAETTRPPVVRGSRLDQVCVDIAPSAYDAEIAFWSALLPEWQSRPGSLPEFHVLTPPAGLPIRILLQRLGEERPTTAHLDLACTDIAATRAAHERLGAKPVAHGTHWTVMQDPAGGTYCLTGRDPETGGLRPQGARGTARPATTGPQTTDGRSRARFGAAHRHSPRSA